MPPQYQKAMDDGWLWMGHQQRGGEPKQLMSLDSPLLSWEGSIPRLDRGREYIHPGGPAFLSATVLLPIRAALKCRGTYCV